MQQKTKTLLLVVMLMLNHLVFAQKVEWASEVLGVSSEFKYDASPNAYKAANVLGEPTSLNYGKPTGCVWSTLTQSNTIPEYIKVKFKKAVNVRQIIINELQNSGSLTRIWLYDEQGKEYEVFSNTTLKPSENGLFIHFIPLTSYKTIALKAQFTTSLVNAYIAVDAIGVSDSEIPYQIKINEIAGDLFKESSERLSDNINSTASELLPVISPDGNTLFFTRQNHSENIGITSNQDVWYSAKDQTTNMFSKAQNIGTPINNSDNNAMLSISADGQTALMLNVYKPDGTTINGISIARKGNNGWELPEEVKVENYYNRSPYGEYHLNADNKTIVMAIQRDDAIGSKDVYVCFAKEDGTWTEPKNLGSSINTVEGETSPFLAADRKTLYFSSSGWLGYGGRDMFMSTRLDETWTKWSKPLNLGSKVNTPGFDAFFAIPASGEYAYYTTNKNDQYKEDIYRIKLPEALKPSPVVLVKGKVYNAKTKEVLGAEIIYESYTAKKILGTAKSDSKTGDYQIVLPAGSSYGFLANSKGYASLNENIDLLKLSKYTEITRDLFLYPLEKGQTIRLNNVYFDTDKYNFKADTYFELDRLVAMLKEYVNLKIEVSGHTDSQGDDEHNQLLSTNRAKAVYDYLIKKGISPERISYKGYGKSKPVATNDTDKGRQQNRRVEFMILEN